LASLKLAVVLLAVFALLLATAAVVDGKFSGPYNRGFGNEAVLLAIYRTWWFVALGVLLFLNVLCATLIRFPWRRQQTGFVVTHAGILVLLVGCLLTQWGGVEADLSVYEEGSSHTAYKSDLDFELKVYPDPKTAAKAPPQQAPLAGRAGMAAPEPAETIMVPFRPGPFNWSDLGRWYLFPWRWARRDRGVLYDRDGIRLEVLDFLRDSDLKAAPPLVLRVHPQHSPKASGSATPPEAWETVQLLAPALPELRFAEDSMLGQSWRALAGGIQVVYWAARSRAETDAFLDSALGTNEPLGTAGRVILYAGRTRYSLPLDGWAPKEARPLGDTGLSVALADVNIQQRRVVLWIHTAGHDDMRHLMLFADQPDRNIHDEEHGVYGTYWLAAPADAAGTPAGKPKAKEAEAGPMVRRPGGPRIDILQGGDRKLYYRVWDPPRVEQLGPLPTGGQPMEAFPGSKHAVAFDVERFVPHDWPGRTLKPNPFAPGTPPRPGAPRRVLVRLTVDDRSEQFWVQALPSGPIDGTPLRVQRKVVRGDGRRVALTLRHQAIELGFDVYLREFDRRLDPGSEMPAEYSSSVDFSDRNAPDEKLAEDVLITLNEPASVVDPADGRCWRLYQSSFGGPWRRNDAEYLRRLGPKSRRGELFLSVLSVNYDPGRPLKYAGTLLVFVGMVIVYSMRGYWKKPRKTDDE
jgi:hypothetical protein